MTSFLHDHTFWRAAIAAAIGFGLLFAWELGAFAQVLPSPPREPPTGPELLFTILMTALLSLDTGLLFWKKRNAACPAGSRRALGISGALGAFALLCPACLLIPVTLFGTTIALAALSPYLPLLRVIVLILLVTSTMVLWPKKRQQ